MSKKLVAYFSCTGTSKHNAELIKEAIGADIYEIKPKIPYTKEDLDWNDLSSRTTIEMKNKNQRTEIADKNAGLEKYDEIILTFPIWWYAVPHIINTFLESYEVKNKRIILFPTSGSSNFGKTVEELKISVDGSTTIEEGKVTHSKASQNDVNEWVKNYKL